MTLPRIAHTTASTAIRPGEPDWYKDAIIYEVHVRSFYDADGDGMGDFKGLTQKLDYIEDLGVTAIWLLPFYPSPWRDDGYDIADYRRIHPAYGTMRDFRAFLREAHRRGLRVITELVMNHTSDQHPWFQRARTSPAGSKWREYYVWSDTPDRYADARIIFKDYEQSNWTWDPEAKAYFWHRFYSHQPDLNFENPAVRKEMFETIDFWFAMGVDGMRLDAVPYLYEEEGTSCENLPATHSFLKELRAHVDAKFADKMLLAEANQWPDDAVAYFGDSDECHMAFHFPLMPRLFMAVRMEDSYPIIEILEQTPPIPECTQWALFLRNHDELTLEMVTDEERDYMYRVYAGDPMMRVNLGIRRRLAPLLGNNRRQIELLNALLFSMRGTPVVYYGDELGMGDNVYLGDRNAVRTPMQWNSSRNAGFSTANPQKLYLPVVIDPEYHYESVNVEAHQNNPHWLLWWMKRLIALRKRHRAFGRGTIEFLNSPNRKVLAFLRQDQDETILVIANLSRFVQGTELDLSQFAGWVPVEMFGRNEFPPIGERPYFFSMGPHSFYWFVLAPLGGDAGAAPPQELPVISVPGPWTSVLKGKGRAALEAILPGYLQRQRWFGAKARRVRVVTIREAISLGGARQTPYVLLLLNVEYFEGEAGQYVLPLAHVSGDRAHTLLAENRNVVIAHCPSTAGDGILVDALWEPGFSERLLNAIAGRRSFSGMSGTLTTSRTRAFRALRGDAAERLEPRVLRAEQSNTSVVFGDRLIMKLFRRLEPGINPDLEVGRFLTERTRLAHVPRVAGAIEYERPRSEPATVAILQEFVPNEGDAWGYTQDELQRFIERVLADPGAEPPSDSGSLLHLAESEATKAAREHIGGFVELARLLGQRTAEMHVALASATTDRAFAPEAYSPFQQRALYQGLRSQATAALRTLRSRFDAIPERAQADARDVLGRESELLARFEPIARQKLSSLAMRIHGDYHLGQVLFTGKDFVIIDFEGEPARPLGERRLKRSALRDVAGMIRSFHYAAYSALFAWQEATGTRAEDATRLEAWLLSWYRHVAAWFLAGYRAAAADARFLPRTDDEFAMLLGVHVLDKALYELSYELNNRPDWVAIPLRGVRDLLDER
ncbi:MAG: maltose alpha-D-glucosyltransferase [Dehalococcoidia bacterium]